MNTAHSKSKWIVCFGIYISLQFTRLSGAAETTNASAKVDPEPGNCVASWGCAPGFASGQELANQTLRQFVRLSAGGNRVRVRLSNETGTQPLVIGSAHLAVAGRDKGTIDRLTDRVVTFYGSPKTTVLPGSPVLSDPVELSVEPLTKLAISLYITRDSGSSVMHLVGQETGYLSSSGDETSEVVLADASTVAERYYLTGVEVWSADNVGSIVCLGDSITDGRGSTPDTDRRWPDRLAERLNEQGVRLGVVNAGISGNRILHDLPEIICGPSALSRFDRDVLSVAGASFLIVLEGINDITHPIANEEPDQSVTRDQVIGGLQQLIVRAHGHHLKVFGGTLLPGEGESFYTAQVETERKAINQWIRTSNAFDGVIDFDAVVRDPDRPTRLRPDYASADNVHPNDAGYRAMADAIDLKLFGGR